MTRGDIHENPRQLGRTAYDGMALLLAVCAVAAPVGKRLVEKYPVIPVMRDDSLIAKTAPVGQKFERIRKGRIRSHGAGNAEHGLVHFALQRWPLAQCPSLKNEPRAELHCIGHRAQNLG